MKKAEEIIINEELLAKSLDYPGYNKLILDLLEEGTTTNGDSKESTLEYTKMNIQRTSRWLKRGIINDELISELKDFPTDIIWLVITEGWCGDAAQSLPFIFKMSEHSSNIDLKLILRDEHPELMDLFLTNGARSIPKLIALKADTLEVMGTWGPRPALAQEKYMSEKDDPEIGTAKAQENLHLWYARDKGAHIQAEFMKLLKNWRHSLV